MEFLKRKHFSLWIIALLAGSVVDVGYGLQGVPTWICLGMKSPFIEFKSELELLANTSISLNITRDEQVLMHEETLQKLGTVIKPVDLRNATTGYVKSELTKKVPPISATRRKGVTENPIIEEMDRKEIELLEEEIDPNTGFPGLNSEDRKFIVPMALKNPTSSTSNTQNTHNSNYNNNNHNSNNQSNEPKKSAASITSSPLPSAAVNDFSTNIDDLKNHILMLQNLTKNDKTFQSKFVVFPSIQKERNHSLFSSPTTAVTPNSYIRHQILPHHPVYSSSIPSTTRKTFTIPPEQKIRPQIPNTPKPKATMDSMNEEDNYNDFAREKITIIPQVLLLNDQTPPDEDNNNDNSNNDNNNNNKEKQIIEDKKEARITYSRRKNFRKTSPSSTTTTTSTPSTSATIMSTIKPQKGQRKRQRNNGERRNRKRQQNCKNVDTPRCQRQRRRQLALSLNVNKNLTQVPSSSSFSPSSSAAAVLADDSHYISPTQLYWNHENRNSNTNNNKRNHHSLDYEDDQKLSRSVRSHHHHGSRKNAGTGRNARSSTVGITIGSNYDGMPANINGGSFSSGRDYLLPPSNVINNNQSYQPYKENIDLNPELCHKVDGMTYGQQKLCVLNTNIMPAVSRGARAAIQECQHQFKTSRWNCSTTDDNTVFGPMTSIGSPEMAFIHALAAATVTSFIARSCRDGQLASCGCSRSARPKQLHDDWTWGGCGDDLEFAYKFSQEFIDIREKERKRGTRGLVSVPPKHEEKLLLHPSDEAKNKGQDSELERSSTTLSPSNKDNNDTSVGNNKNNNTNSQVKEDNSSPFKPEVLLELKEKITKEIFNSKLQENEMLELQEKINREILNSKVFNLDFLNNNNNNQGGDGGRGTGAGGNGLHTNGKKQHQRNGYGQMVATAPYGGNNGRGGMKNGISAKARSLMNLHNNEAGRRAVIKKTRITCKCHGVSGSCSLITCWQQLSSIREIGDYLREKYDAATEVKLNKRGRLQVKDPRYKVPTAHDLVYLDESPDWCRNNRQLQWPGTHGRVCNKTSSGLDGCAILCCGRGYNTRNIVVRERCNCKFHWCCHVKCETCVKVLEEHTCK